MKFYVASKFENQKKVLEIYEKLKENGHEITVDWTKSDGEKAKRDPETARKYAERDIKGVKDADVFVLLTTDIPGKGRFIELGAAMILNILNGRPRIFVIGDYNTESIFFFHSVVNRVKSIEDVIKELEKSEIL
jgi:hypothetical protein